MQSIKVTHVFDLPEEMLVRIEERLAARLERLLDERVNAIMAKPRNLTRDEVAAKLRVSLPTLHKYEKNGLIKGQRIGRRVVFSEGEIDAYLQRSSRTATSGNP
jgi:excisionase family DNA binding protein